LSWLPRQAKAISVLECRQAKAFVVEIFENTSKKKKKKKRKIHKLYTLITHNINI